MSDLHSNNQCDMLFNTAGESMVENFGETSQQSTVCNRVKKPVTVPLFKSLCLQNYKRPTGLTTHFYTFFKTFKCQMVTNLQVPICPINLLFLYCQTLNRFQFLLMGVLLHIFHQQVIQNLKVPNMLI